MLPPPDPETGVGIGWACRWTATGARLLIDVFLGNATLPSTLTLAACAASPDFTAEDEVTTDALNAVELTGYPGGLYAEGVQRGTLSTAPFDSATSWDLSKVVSGDEVSFGRNTGTNLWPAVSHLVLLNGDDPIAVMKLSGAVQTAPRFQLRVPQGQFRFFGSTTGNVE